MLLRTGLQQLCRLRAGIEGSGWSLCQGAYLLFRPHRMWHVEFFTKEEAELLFEFFLRDVMHAWHAGCAGWQVSCEGRHKEDRLQDWQEMRRLVQYRMRRTISCIPSWGRSSLVIQGVCGGASRHRHIMSMIDASLRRQKLSDFCRPAVLAV